MIETRLISISKPRRTFTKLLAKTEIVPRPPVCLVRVAKKAHSNEVVTLRILDIPQDPLKVTVKELKRIEKEVECHTCGKEIRKGTPHKTAQVVIVDRNAKTSQTKHLPLHVTCEYSQ